ncbi:MAG TPA: dihydrolipoamide acetyltransferase family protein [Euzebyales bacterium]|nr:dihydrolipoamide acetyltransferase family protein [Euzebyales bacterium]
MPTQQMRLPDLGEGLTEATIVRWLVDEGDTVIVDQVVAEVETAKATVDLPAPFAGVVAARHADEGEEVAVGATVLTLRSDDDADADDGAGERGAGAHEATSAGDEDGGSDEEEGRKLLVGLGPAAPRRRRRRAQSTHHQTPARPARPRAKPPVRKLAKDLGVDLAAVTGTGPDGRITRDDVHAAATVESVESVESQTPDHAADGAQRIPVTGVRARIAEHLSVAWREIPAAACWLECDASRLMQLRDELAAAHPDVKLTPLALVLRCCVVALRNVPQLNASFDVDGRQIVQHEAVHLGVAVQTDRGLVVPVVRDAGGRSVLDLAAAVQQVATQARDNTLTPAQMVGGTFTVSNFGAFGVDGGTPIINHPQAAILGVGRITPRPWVVDDRVEVRQVVQLSLTFDHRVCDGAEAGGFLRRLADLVQRPTLLLAH